MNKRAITLAVGLTLLGVAVRGQDADYTVKITDTDKAKGYVLARFVIVPQDLRILCKGTDVTKVFAGDYVKIEIRNGKFALKNTDAVCDSIAWLK